MRLAREPRYDGTDPWTGETVQAYVQDPPDADASHKLPMRRAAHQERKRSAPGEQLAELPDADYTIAGRSAAAVASGDAFSTTRPDRVHPVLGSAREATRSLGPAAPARLDDVSPAMLRGEEGAHGPFGDREPRDEREFFHGGLHPKRRVERLVGGTGGLTAQGAGYGHVNETERHARFTSEQARQPRLREVAEGTSNPSPALLGAAPQQAQPPAGRFRVENAASVPVRFIGASARESAWASRAPPGTVKDARRRGPQAGPGPREQRNGGAGALAVTWAEPVEPRKGSGVASAARLSERGFSGAPPPAIFRVPTGSLPMSLRRAEGFAAWSATSASAAAGGPAAHRPGVSAHSTRGPRARPGSMRADAAGAAGSASRAEPGRVPDRATFGGGGGGGGAFVGAAAHQHLGGAQGQARTRAGEGATRLVFAGRDFANVVTGPASAAVEGPTPDVRVAGGRVGERGAHGSHFGLTEGAGGAGGWAPGVASAAPAPRFDRTPGAGIRSESTLDASGPPRAFAQRPAAPQRASGAPAGTTASSFPAASSATGSGHVPRWSAPHATVASASSMLVSGSALAGAPLGEWPAHHQASLAPKYEFHK